MILLGINAYHGDASAVVLAGGKLLFAVEEERLNRVKHSAGVPQGAVTEILSRANLSSKEIEYFTISRNPAANLIPKAKFVLRNRPPLSYVKGRFAVAKASGEIWTRLQSVIASPEGAKQSSTNLPARQGSLRRFTPRNDVTHVEHHLSHAASAFYPSGFERAALLTVDGFGDFSSTMLGIGEGNKIKVLKRILFPHSLGVLYTAATQFLGFPKYGDEYKVMGLSGWGEPRFRKDFEHLIRLAPDGTFKLNLDFFTHPQGKTEMSWEEGEPVLGTAHSQKWEELFGPPRHPDEPITERDKDLAASVQLVFEESLFHLLRQLYERTRIKTLCYAGGCAFNSVANGKIFDQTPFEKVYIQPAAGDAGTALGSALYVAHHRLNQPRNFGMDHAYWGPAFNEAELNEELKIKNEKSKEAGCILKEVESGNEICREAARAIVEGKIVGWFQGRMEWGPRALGNRSILADPRRAEVKDILNERIKHRENFRPFAPSVLEEKASDWFEMKSLSPFMNFVFPVRPEKRNQIPAVTHIDGTARVHTVSKETNPLFWNLIYEFEKITGVPMLLNTSFNENEPIVCSPTDALDCFFRTRMDLLVLGSYWIERKQRSFHAAHPHS